MNFKSILFSSLGPPKYLDQNIGKVSILSKQGISELEGFLGGEVICYGSTSDCDVLQILGEEEW